MTPAALRTLGALQSLDLPAGVLHGIDIAADGKPIFARLSDAQFDEFMRACRRVWPNFDDLARKGREALTPQGWSLPTS